MLALLILLAMADIVGAMSWARVIPKYFQIVGTEEQFQTALNHYLPFCELSNISTDWSEYCISLMQLLLTEFPNFSRAITESVDWVSYEVARDTFWWMDMDNLNSYADLMEEFNSVVKTFSTSTWVWHDVHDCWLFEQPLH